METIEFHNTPDGNVYYRVDGGVEKRLTKFSIEVFPIRNYTAIQPLQTFSI